MFRYAKIAVVLSVMLVMLGSSLVPVASAWAPRAEQPKSWGFRQPAHYPSYNTNVPATQPYYPNYNQGNTYYPNYNQGNTYYPNFNQGNTYYPNYNQANTYYPNFNQGNTYYYPPTVQGNTCNPTTYGANNYYPNPSYASCAQPPVIVLQPPAATVPICPPSCAAPAPVFNQAPPNFVTSWGTFGTYDNWARCFFQEHGRLPGSQDVNDFWYSQQYAYYNGVSPYPSTGCGSNNCRY